MGGITLTACERRDTMKFTEKELSRDIKFSGRIFSVAKCKAELPDNTIVDRELVCHSGGVCILPVDSENNGYFVRQYRYGAGKELLEVPAGKLEEGEDPLSAALRELSEETGFTAEKIVKLGVGYSSPAILTEKIYMYLATGLCRGAQHLDKDEFLEVVKCPLEEMYQNVLDNKIEDSKSQITILKSYLYLKSKDKE